MPCLVSIVGTINLKFRNGMLSLIIATAIIVCVSTATPGDPRTSTFQDEFTAELTAELEDFANQNNMGIWVALKSEDFDFAFSLGSSDGAKTKALNTDVIPTGSYAKPWTAVAILRLVEDGKIDLDGAIVPLLDPVLTRINGTTMRELGWGAEIENVTVRMLLHMTAGIMTYNDTTIMRETLQDPAYDITPQDYLAINSKRFSCAPGECDGVYCSIDFLLLGLIWLGQTTSKGDWDSLDMMTALPVELRDSYPGTTFFKRGPCSKYTNVSHYFQWLGVDKTTHKSEFIDMYDHSCLNGFAFGNIGTTATDAAKFFYDLLGPEKKIVSGRSVLEMQQFGPGLMMATPGLYYGVSYGLGIWETTHLSMYEAWLNNSHPHLWKYLTYVGHAGDDYGTVSRQGWHETLRFSHSMIINRQKGDYPVTDSNMHMVYCTFWKTIFKLMLKDVVPNAEQAFTCPSLTR
eukprot:m.48216 g.48216  ORF g.48216 m.48216 type:complete len:460 (-) comp20690_c0_seq1:260-1639(-)